MSKKLGMGLSFLAAVAVVSTANAGIGSKVGSSVPAAVEALTGAQASKLFAGKLLDAKAGKALTYTAAEAAALSKSGLSTSAFSALVVQGLKAVSPNGEAVTPEITGKLTAELEKTWTANQGNLADALANNVKGLSRESLLGTTHASTANLGKGVEAKAAAGTASGPLDAAEKKEASGFGADLVTFHSSLVELKKAQSLLRKDAQVGLVATSKHASEVYTELRSAAVNRKAVPARTLAGFSRTVRVLRHAAQHGAAGFKGNPNAYALAAAYAHGADAHGIWSAGADKAEAFAMPVVANGLNTNDIRVLQGAANVAQLDKRPAGAEQCLIGDRNDAEKIPALTGGRLVTAGM